MFPDSHVVVWTVGDVIGLTALALIVVGVTAVWVLMWLRDAVRRLLRRWRS
jgi:uncharacterized membrane protein YuzA (DUF378 family)